MAPPSADFRVHHLLNPWMQWHERVDHRRARRQWERLAAAITEAGAQLELMSPSRASGALTFTRDAAVSVGADRMLVLRNHGRRGDLEPAHVAVWLRDRGFVVEQSHAHRLDGGNVLPTAWGWLIGIPPGVDDTGPRWAASRLGGPVIGVPLAGSLFPHLDMVLADLAGRGWLVHPDGLADPAMRGPEWDRVLGSRPMIAVEDDEARRLATNVVVVGETVIGGGLSVRICRAIEELDLEPVPVELDEFRRAGGGAHCLTLELTPRHRETSRRWRGAPHDSPQDAAGRGAAG